MLASRQLYTRVAFFKNRILFQFLENLNILQKFTQSIIPIKKAPKKEKNIVKIVTNKQKLNK